MLLNRLYPSQTTDPATPDYHFSSATRHTTQRERERGPAEGAQTQLLSLIGMASVILALFFDSGSVKNKKNIHNWNGEAAD